MPFLPIRRGSAFLAALAGTLVLAPAAGAATYTVTTTADDIPATAADCAPNAVTPNCSLREAVLAANEDGGDDTVTVRPGEYVLVNENDPDGSADIDVLAENSSNAFAGNLTIAGAGARSTIIRSGAEVAGDIIRSRAFDVEGGTTTGGCTNIPGPAVVISGLTITRGTDGSGGAIRHQDGDQDCNGEDNPALDSQLTVLRSTLGSNGSGSSGGAIWSGGELTVAASTISNNVSGNGEGGGIFSSDTVTLVNTTVSGNSANGAGGGIMVRDNSIEPRGNAGDELQGSVLSVNSTFAHNVTDFEGGAVFVQGPFNSDGAVATFRNTVFAGNRAPDGRWANCGMPQQTSSLGGNVEDGSNCGFYSANDQSNADARIGTLRDNGGSTNTHALLPGSPAIDGAADVDCPSEDQRGVSRPQGPKCDSGAFEAPVPAAAPPTTGGLVDGRCANVSRGTSEDDVLNGSVFGDAISGLGGDDVINGLQGDDCLSGDGGGDVLTGSEGNDTLTGDDGEDILSGGVGDDRLFSGDGNDKLTGGSGRDLLSGGNGRDKLSGGTGDDRLLGGASNDTIDGGQGTNRISAGAGNDIVNSANGERETINCGSGRRDVARADLSDTVRNCERVLRLRSSSSKRR